MLYIFQQQHCFIMNIININITRISVLCSVTSVKVRLRLSVVMLCPMIQHTSNIKASMKVTCQQVIKMWMQFSQTLQKMTIIILITWHFVFKYPYSLSLLTTNCEINMKIAKYVPSWVLLGSIFLSWYPCPHFQQTCVSSTKAGQHKV